MSDIRVYAKSVAAPRATDDTWVALRSTRDGAPIVLPWHAALAIEGKVYQVRLGTITTPLTGDVDITDAAAEAAAEAASGYVILPLAVQVTVEALGGTLPVAAFKSAGALITTLGTAFVPLNLKIGGAAANARAAVAAAGGVAVVAELATTTRVHVIGQTSAIGDAQPNLIDREFDVPPVLVGPASCYLQVAAVTTGPTYFAFFNFAEFTTGELT